MSYHSGVDKIRRAVLSEYPQLESDLGNVLEELESKINALIRKEERRRGLK